MVISHTTSNSAASVRQIPGQTGGVCRRPGVVVLAALPDAVAHAYEVGGHAADGRDLLRHPPGRTHVHIAAVKHLRRQTRRHAVEQYRAFGPDSLQPCRQVTRPLDGGKAPAVAVGDVPPDAGQILAVVWLHGGPVVHGLAAGQSPRHALGRAALAAFAAADKQKSHVASTVKASTARISSR